MSAATGFKGVPLYVSNTVMLERAFYASLETWHVRLDHLSLKGMFPISSDNVAKN